MIRAARIGHVGKMTRAGARSAARRAAVILLMSAAPGACTALEEWGQTEPSRTGGVTMSLSIRRPDQQSFELFRVTREGKLEYGGGLRAFNDSTNWTGAMTEAEIRAFLEALDRNGWCHDSPPTDRESSITCRIELRCTESRHTWTIRGEPESVVEMRKILDPIARRRLQPELDRLPEASEARTMTHGAQRPPRHAETGAEGAANPSHAPGAGAAGGTSGP